MLLSVFCVHPSGISVFCVHPCVCVCVCVYSLRYRLFVGGWRSPLRQCLCWVHLPPEISLVYFHTFSLFTVLHNYCLCRCFVFTPVVLSLSVFCVHPCGIVSVGVLCSPLWHCVSVFCVHPCRIVCVGDLCSHSVVLSVLCSPLGFCLCRCFVFTPNVSFTGSTR